MAEVQSPVGREKDGERETEGPNHENHVDDTNVRIKHTHENREIAMHR